MNLKLKTTHLLQTPYTSITSSNDSFYLLNNDIIDQYTKDFKKIKSYKIEPLDQLKYHNKHFIGLNKNHTCITVFNHNLKPIKTVCLLKLINQFGPILQCTLNKDRIILSCNKTILVIHINNDEHLEKSPYNTSYPFLTTYLNKQSYVSLINDCYKGYLVFNSPCKQSINKLDKCYKDYCKLNDHYYFINTCNCITCIDEYIDCNQSIKEKPCNDKIICSIANVENGLANILHEQANTINEVIEQSTNIEDIITINNKTTETIDSITQLENTLLLKLKAAK